MKDYLAFLIKGIYIIYHKIAEPFFKFKHYIKYEAFKNSPYLMKYYGYDVFYRKGDGAVNHLASGYPYEKDVISVALAYLKENAVVFDVGANIGLITLAIAGSKKEVKFHCFEPSPYPYLFFKNTIERNWLNNRVKLNNIGLYHKSGRSNFFVHAYRHALGDGLKDTGRAGKSKPILIKVTTLDKYVKKEEIKKIDLIKIDVEGAELYVLRGAVESINKFKPKIIFEASKKNLKAYNINLIDIYNFFHRLKYKIHPLGTENYFAVPS